MMMEQGYQFDRGGYRGSPHINDYLTSWTTWQLEVYHKPKHNNCDYRNSRGEKLRKLHNVGIGKDFLTEHKIRGYKRKKLIKWTSSKLCNSHSSKGTIKKTKRQATDWEKFLKHIPDKELLSRVCKEPIQLNETKKEVKNEQKTWIGS